MSGLGAIRSALPGWSTMPISDAKGGAQMFSRRADYGTVQHPLTEAVGRVDLRPTARFFRECCRVRPGRTFLLVPVSMGFTHVFTSPDGEQNPNVRIVAEPVKRVQGSNPPRTASCLHRCEHSVRQALCRLRRRPACAAGLWGDRVGAVRR